MFNLKRVVSFFLFAVPLLFYGQSNIFDVARSGTIEDVKRLMSINPDTINKTDTNGYLPLTLACYRGNKDVAIFLASKVNNIDGLSDYGTPLMAAVYKNRAEIVEQLLKFKANTNFADANGTTALHYAIILRNEQIIKLLIESNADVNLKDNRGVSAKEYAIMTQNETIIELINKN
jgi:hypothetical protein